MIGAVSELALRNLGAFGFETESAFVYPNSARSEFFDYSYSRNSSLRSIAVVSNHVPEELRQFAILVGDSGVNVTFIEKDDNYELATPELLSNFDLIISIGKTVYYSLAMGIPTYMYDVDVLEGYVTKTNYLDNFTSNFAKKSPGRHKSSKEIWLKFLWGMIGPLPIRLVFVKTRAAISPLISYWSES